RCCARSPSRGAASSRSTCSRPARASPPTAWPAARSPRSRSSRSPPRRPVYPGEPIRRSELPKFFFCLHELLGHLRDDPVLLHQPLPKRVDLALQVALLGAGLLRERGRAVLEELLLPGVEQRGTHVVFLAHLRHRLSLQQDLPQDGDLLRRAVLPVSP